MTRDELLLAVSGVAGTVVAWFMGLHAFIHLLAGLMVADIAIGILSSRGNLSWVKFAEGVRLKTIELILVGVGAGIAAAVPAIGQNAPLGISLGELVAGFYAAYEMASIGRNAKGVGLPVPQWLLDAAAHFPGAPKPDPVPAAREV